jgi:hypothetical protein
VNESQRIEFRDRLRQNLFDVKMALYIDETHKSANASRRRRMWAKRGVPKTADACFEEVRKRYTMIGACDVNGFVKEATTRASFQTDTGLDFSSTRVCCTTNDVNSIWDSCGYDDTRTNR